MMQRSSFGVTGLFVRWGRPDETLTGGDETPDSICCAGNSSVLELAVVSVGPSLISKLLSSSAIELSDG